MDIGGEYHGHFEFGEMNGFGSLFLADGSAYEGELDHSIPHGNGKMVYATGGSYEGDWSNGQREGRGRMTYPDKRQYVGEWVGGRRHGHGEMISPTGDVIKSCEWIADIPVQDRDVEIDAEMIPTVDIDEFLREIMPASISPGELEESRFRKRIELEEVYQRVRIPVLMDERLSFFRIMKHFLFVAHQEVRKNLLEEQLEERNTHERTTLAKILNVWKASFKVTFDRDPKKSDLVGDPQIAPLYRRYTELS
jgi:hypothetical protein